MTMHLVLITTLQAVFTGSWNLNYYMNTDEIPGELLCKKNDIFSREDNMLKLYVNIKILPFEAQPLIYYFNSIYTINRILHGRLEIPNFYSRVEKYFNMRNVVSPRAYNVLYLTNFPSHTLSIWILDKLFLLQLRDICE